MRRPVAAAALLALSPLLDDFSSVGEWTAAPADGVKLELSEDGGALRLDFDYQGHAGWAAARKAFPLRLPENWAFRFRVRGETAPQTLEFKLLDASGQNVWWSVRRDFAFPREWTTLTVRRRQVSFAWGPAGGGELRELGSIEFAIVNASGGRGTVWIDDLSFEESKPATGPLPVVRGWKSAAEASQLVLDLGGRREFSGLSLAWDAADFARRYEIEFSDDGKTWSRVRSVSAGGPGRARILLPDSEAAFVRLRFLESARGSGYALEEAVVVAPEAWDNPTKLLESVAKEEPRGRWPRSFAGEQIYWTLVGVDGGAEKGLFSEDGALEVGRGEFSLEPFLATGGKLLGWNEAEISQSLAEADLPIPSVLRKYPGGLSVEVTAFADGPPAVSTMRARYRVRNSRTTVERVTLYLALRPVQVNPPSQWLGRPGGFAPLRRFTRAAGRSWRGRRRPRSVRSRGRPERSWRASPPADCPMRRKRATPRASHPAPWPGISRYRRAPRATSSSRCRSRRAPTKSRPPTRPPIFSREWTPPPEPGARSSAQRPSRCPPPQRRRRSPPMPTSPGS
jgi:F5/8 type C domain